MLPQVIKLLLLHPSPAAALLATSGTALHAPCSMTDAGSYQGSGQQQQQVSLTNLPAMLALVVIIFCARATFSDGTSMARSPRAIMMPSA